MPVRRQAIIWTTDCLVYWRIYASRRLNELNTAIYYSRCRWTGDRSNGKNLVVKVYTFVGSLPRKVKKRKRKLLCKYILRSNVPHMTCQNKKIVINQSHFTSFIIFLLVEGVTLRFRVQTICKTLWHDDVVNWKLFPRCWPFVREIHWSPVNSPYKGQWHGALMISSICTWINDWVNNGEAGDLGRHRTHYDVSVMGQMYRTSPP